MGRPLQIGLILLLLAGATVLNAQKANPEAKPNKMMAPPPKGFPKGGVPKGPGGGPHLNNPANQFERLIAMSPEKRDQLLERLPPSQQARLRERLDRWDKLPAPQKALQLEMLNRYAALPPERQESYLRQIQAVNALEAPRRMAVIRELRMLWRMPDEQRQRRLASDDYKARFSPAELQMLQEISSANLLPTK